MRHPDIRNVYRSAVNDGAAAGEEETGIGKAFHEIVNAEQGSFFMMERPGAGAFDGAFLAECGIVPPEDIDPFTCGLNDERVAAE